MNDVLAALNSNFWIREKKRLKKGLVRSSVLVQMASVFLTSYNSPPQEPGWNNPTPHSRISFAQNRYGGSIPSRQPALIYCSMLEAGLPAGFNLFGEIPLYQGWNPQLISFVNRNSTLLKQNCQCQPDFMRCSKLSPVDLMFTSGISDSQPALIHRVKIFAIYT